MHALVHDAEGGPADRVDEVLRHRRNVSEVLEELAGHAWLGGLEARAATETRGSHDDRGKRRKQVPNGLFR